ncbi:MAG: hypothetical protein ACXWIU_14420 [Limisphaerales bacterium]
MLEKIVLTVISGLLFPMLLEIWKQRRKQKEAATTGSQSSGKLSKVLSIGGRLIFSPVIGFFLAPGAAAFLESRGHPRIEFGSDLCVIFIVLFSIIAWFILSSAGPFKSKT